MVLILAIIQFIIIIALISVVLLQYNRGSQLGASFGSGAQGALQGSAPPMTLLAKITAFIAFLFIVNALLISVAYKNSTREGSSLVDEIQKLQVEKDSQPKEKTKEATSTIPSDLPK